MLKVEALFCTAQVLLQQEPCPKDPSLHPRKPLPSELWPWAQGSPAGVREKSPGLFCQLLGVATFGK